LARDCAGYGIESLFENANAGVEPIAIAVERVDRRGQSPGFALAFPRRELKLLRLLQQVGRCGLFMPHADRRLVGDEGYNDRADRDGRPGSEPPERAPVKFVFLGEQAGKRAAGLFLVEAAAQPVGNLRHAMSSAPLRPQPNQSVNINRKWPVTLNP
jgi:hypothetical protein